MNVSTRIILIFLTILGLLSAVVFSMNLLANSMQKAATAELLRYESNKLADQLRQSSDDLTRMARTYVVTGDPVYEQYFYKILAIRDGTSPRPKKYGGIYWNFVTATKEAPTSPGAPVALIELMKRVGIAPQEMAKLEEAKNNSDQLINLEIMAFAAMKGLFADDTGKLTIHRDPDPDFARKILHGDQYHQAKTEIMRPIGEFLDLLDQRTRLEVSVNRTDVDRYQIITIALVAATILFSIFAFFHIRRKIIIPIISLSSTSARIQSGATGERAEVTSADEVGTLAGAFNAMVESLQLQITERKQVELSLREKTTDLEDANAALTNAQHIAHLGSWTLDLRTKALTWSDEIYLIFGLRPQEFEATYEAFVDAVHPDDRETVKEAVANSLEHLTPYSIDHRVVTPDGEVRNVHEEGEVFVDDTGVPLRMIGTVQDITELKKIEGELREAMAEADQANLAKSRFLSSMSHELRTPLNAVIGFSQLMQHNPKEPLTPAQKEYTDDIIYSGEMLLELINGVLDLAKIEADQLHLSMEDVYASDVIDECITLVLPSTEKHDITITNRTPDQPPCLIHTDALRLKQVLLNFLSNAAKYNKPGGTVTLDSVETDDGYLRISVTDTGIGISPEHHADIFKPFDRLGIEAKRTIEGTGIGLTVTKQLTERMGGRIGFESIEHKGSTFWIEIPLASKRSELVWNDKLSVGIQPVDDDHKVLIGLLNELSEPNLGTNEVEAIIGNLIDYTLYHFRREEGVMEACGYPHLDDHRRVHRHLATKVGQFAEKWRDSGDAEVVQELLEFLRTWLVDHIMQDDAEIGPYAKDKEAEIEQALKKISNVE